MFASGRLGGGKLRSTIVGPSSLSLSSSFSSLSFSLLFPFSSEVSFSAIFSFVSASSAGVGAVLVVLVSLRRDFACSASCFARSAISVTFARSEIIVLVLAFRFLVSAFCFVVLLGVFF